MDDHLESEPNCPLGKVDCSLVEEVRGLREQVKQFVRLSQTDPLTGLYNFRYLINALGREMERTRRTRLTTALIMIDLDHFKRVNDQYGHQTGNHVLQWCANLWSQEIRRIDMLCRYGGEEFSVILPATRLYQAVQVAERLRSKLAGSPIRIQSLTIPLSASFGVDVYRPHEELTVDEFIERTDQHLLKAKVCGRNRVCFEESRVSRPPTEVSPEERVAFFATRWPGDSRNDGSQE